MRVDVGAAGAIAVLMVLTAAGCCPVPPGGPTSTGVTNTLSLPPGDIRHVDVDVPESTTQLNLEFHFETPDARLRVRQIEPDCTPAPGDTCPARRETIITPPAGVRRISSGAVATPGARTRIVLENVSDVTLNLTLTVVPWRAGCT